MKETRRGFMNRNLSSDRLYRYTHFRLIVPGTEKPPAARFQSPTNHDATTVLPVVTRHVVPARRKVGTPPVLLLLLLHILYYLVYLYISGQSR